VSHNHEHSHQRPSLRALFNNFSSYEAPFHEKLGLALRNTFIKVRTHSSCCGHPGQPGC